MIENAGFLPRRERDRRQTRESNPAIPGHPLKEDGKGRFQRLGLETSLDSAMLASSHALPRVLQ
jgi:hypothetical protein